MAKESKEGGFLPKDLREKTINKLAHLYADREDDMEELLVKGCMGLELMSDRELVEDLIDEVSLITD